MVVLPLPVSPNIPNIPLFKRGAKSIVDLSEKLSLVATVGNLGWETTSLGGDVWENYDASSTFDFGVDLTQINFAMYYNF